MYLLFILFLFLVWILSIKFGVVYIVVLCSLVLSRFSFFSETTCADPENFVRGGPNKFDNVFYS